MIFIAWKYWWMHDWWEGAGSLVLDVPVTFRPKAEVCGHAAWGVLQKESERSEKVHWNSFTSSTGIHSYMRYHISSLIVFIFFSCASPKHIEEKCKNNDCNKEYLVLHYHGGKVFRRWEDRKKPTLWGQEFLQSQIYHHLSIFFFSPQTIYFPTYLLENSVFFLKLKKKKKNNYFF